MHRKVVRDSEIKKQKYDYDQDNFHLTILKDILEFFFQNFTCF